MVKIKFCGMTTPADCMKAVDLGVDFIGFVFYKGSPRYVTPDAVREMAAQIAGRARTVGIFVEEKDDEILDTMDFCGLDFCQVFHSSHIPNRIMTYRIKDHFPEISPGNDGLILFDTYSEGLGGSGRSFDLKLLHGAPFLDRAFVAGGISEENVTSVMQLSPFGVDLVSSIESSPGKKDHTRMESFVKKVRGSIR
jgi:phosphoribosylanthranilate isomerase